MKKIRGFLYALISLALLSACDEFLDINVSPNATTNPPVRTIMASATADLGFRMGSDIHRYTALWVQQFTGGGGVGIQTVEYSRYNLTPTDVNNVWRAGFYGVLLADLQKIIDQTEGNSPMYSGIAKIMQAYAFATVTDCWGDIPFSEALTFVNVTPVYDASDNVYAGVLALIDEGIADLNTPNSPTSLVPAGDDLVYGGNASNWIRFANSLKLRMLIKYYPSDDTFADTEIAALLATPGITFVSTNAQIPGVVFETSQDRQNPIDQFERRRQNQFWPTTTLVDMMNATTDPRRPFYFRDVTGVYVGLTPGSTVTSPATSRMHTYLRGATTSADPILGYAGNTPIRFLTLAEHHFNLAEYYLRTGDNANAQTSFTAGITASMDLATVAAADRNTYLAANGTLTGTFATDLQMIITEKYIANYGIAVQPWSDWRRTGFPVLTPVPGAALAQIPRIIPYSDLERVTNPANTPARPDITAATVFWDPGL